MIQASPGHQRGPDDGGGLGPEDARVLGRGAECVVVAGEGVEGAELVPAHSTVQHSTVQHSTVQYSTVQHSTAQYSTVQNSTAQYSTV